MLRALPLALSALVLVACSASDSTPSESADPSAGSDVASWSYSGSTGPESWGTLSPEFATCEQGTRQSPIQIEDPEPVKRKSPQVSYRAQSSVVENNGHSVEAGAGPGNTMSVDGTDFELERMHFHAPAETVVGDNTYPAELHFVHQSEKGDFAVFAVFLTEGKANPGLEGFVESMSTPLDAESIHKIDWPGMVPADTTTVRFDGSLTTPDCSEGIQWLVATTPIEASAEQLATIRAAYDDNARPVQPLNGRSVTVDAS